MSVMLDVRDLLGHPGESREAHVAHAVPGLSTELARVPEDREVHANLLLECVVEGVLVTGSLSGVLVESCARCLEPFERPFEVRVQELFAPGVVADDAQEYPLVEGEADLEPMIRDAVILDMPYSPLCSPDCLGLCGRCGANRNQDGCTCPDEPVDERWAALAEIRLPEALQELARHADDG